jgi:hypothetical protein
LKGFALANNTEASAFEIIGSDPERGARFATAMSIYATKPEYSPTFLTDYYDWESLGPVQVVAVGGGSHLQVLVELTRRFDNVQVTAQDAPPVVAQLGDGAVPAELQGRLRLAAHDLFAPQSAHCDILLLRWTLHLWSNEYCKKILRAQIPVLGPNTRIIIQDSFMPKPGTVALWKEQDLRCGHTISLVYPAPAGMPLPSTDSCPGRVISTWQIFSTARSERCRSGRIC